MAINVRPDVLKANRNLRLNYPIVSGTHFRRHGSSGSMQVTLPGLKKVTGGSRIRSDCVVEMEKAPIFCVLFTTGYATSGRAVG